MCRGLSRVKSLFLITLKHYASGNNTISPEFSHFHRQLSNFPTFPDGWSRRSYIQTILTCWSSGARTPVLDTEHKTVWTFSRHGTQLRSLNYKHNIPPISTLHFICYTTWTFWYVGCHSAVILNFSLIFYSLFKIYFYISTYCSTVS